ncbi:MAG: YoaK family protein [Bauldia sp.]|jgi:uncharacterized membrane protein YoaK (UPF0700 family)
MIQLQRAERALAAGLAAVAGFVDAVGFLTLGGFFVSFMSGNSTRLAAGLAEGSFTAAVTALVLIALFVVGVGIGSAAGHYAWARRRPVVLGLVATLLAAAALLASLGADGRLVMALATIAMGATNAVFERGGEVSIGLTYMTGTLVKFGQRLTGALLRYGERGAWRPYLFHWLALVFGAIAGAVAYRFLAATALWAAAIAAAAAGVFAQRVLSARAG